LHQLTQQYEEKLVESKALTKQMTGENIRIIEELQGKDETIHQLERELDEIKTGMNQQIKDLNIKYQSQVETNIALVDKLQSESMIKDNLQSVINDCQQTIQDL